MDINNPPKSVSQNSTTSMTTLEFPISVDIQAAIAPMTPIKPSYVATAGEFCTIILNVQ